MIVIARDLWFLISLILESASEEWYQHSDRQYPGAIPPHLPESNEQNLIVIEAFLEAAKRYARGGYDVIVDGIVGPWFLEPWLNIVQEHYEVHYMLRLIRYLRIISSTTTMEK